MSKRLSTAGQLAAVAALVTGMLAGAPSEALAAYTTATAACKLELGSVTPGGDHTDKVITAGSPTTFTDSVYFRKVLQPGDQPMLFGE